MNSEQIAARIEKIVRLEPGITQTELAERLDIRQPTVSRHLRILGLEGRVPSRRNHHDYLPPPDVVAWCDRVYGATRRMDTERRAAMIRHLNADYLESRLDRLPPVVRARALETIGNLRA